MSVSVASTQHIWALFILMLSAHSYFCDHQCVGSSALTTKCCLESRQLLMLIDIIIKPTHWSIPPQFVTRIMDVCSQPFVVASLCSVKRSDAVTSLAYWIGMHAKTVIQHVRGQEKEAASIDDTDACLHLKTLSRGLVTLTRRMLHSDFAEEGRGEEEGEVHGTLCRSSPGSKADESLHNADRSAALAPESVQDAMARLISRGEWGHCVSDWFDRVAAVVGVSDPATCPEVSRTRASRVIIEVLQNVSASLKISIICITVSVNVSMKPSRSTHDSTRTQWSEEGGWTSRLAVPASRRCGRWRETRITPSWCTACVASSSPFCRRNMVLELVLEVGAGRPPPPPPHHHHHHQQATPSFDWKTGWAAPLVSGHGRGSCQCLQPTLTRLHSARLIVRERFALVLVCLAQLLGLLYWAPSVCMGPPLCCRSFSHPRLPAAAASCHGQAPGTTPPCALTALFPLGRSDERTASALMMRVVRTWRCLQLQRMRARGGDFGVEVVTSGTDTCPWATPMPRRAKPQEGRVRRHIVARRRL
jgi:hypothetical protein